MGDLMVKAKSKQVESPAKKKIVLIDDHPIFRRGLKELIEAEEHLEVVGEAASSQQALDVIKRSEADLVICDISLDGTGGLELIKQVQAQHNDSVRFLVCSVHDECIFAERALQAGASGYVQKSEEPTVILTAVDRVLDLVVGDVLGRPWVDPPKHVGLYRPKRRILPFLIAHLAECFADDFGCRCVAAAFELFLDVGRQVAEMDVHCRLLHPAKRIGDSRICPIWT